MLAACAPSIAVKPDTLPGAPGVRYYLPAPYLLVTYGMGGEFRAVKKKVPRMLGSTVVNDEIETWEWFPIPDAENSLKAQIVYLPDLTQRYRIAFVPGTGSSKHSFTLKEGWLLTEMNAEGDNQLDEAVNSFASLIKAVPSLGLGMAAPLTEADVAATREKPVRLFKMSYDATSKSLKFAEVDIPSLLGGS